MFVPWLASGSLSRLTSDPHSRQPTSIVNRNTTLWSALKAPQASWQQRLLVHSSKKYNHIPEGLTIVFGSAYYESEYRKLHVDFLLWELKRHICPIHPTANLSSVLTSNAKSQKENLKGIYFYRPKFPMCHKNCLLKWQWRLTNNLPIKIQFKSMLHFISSNTYLI